MLGKPDAGWSDFQLKDTSRYALSYLNDIAFQWVDQAIHGLETLLPFCVKGFMEPGHFLCIVSYWNCHILCEDEGRCPLNKDDIEIELSHTSMLQFCQYLYDDISQNIDEWVSFPPFFDASAMKRMKKHRKKALSKKLSRLDRLISENKQQFGDKRIFL